MAMILFILLTFMRTNVCAKPMNKTLVAAKPNIILEMTDDHGYGVVEIIKTPMLDKLANDSIRLTNFYVDPTC